MIIAIISFIFHALVWETLASGYDSFLVPDLRLLNCFLFQFTSRVGAESSTDKLLVSWLPKELGYQASVHKNHLGKFPKLQKDSNSGGLGRFSEAAF